MITYERIKAWGKDHRSALICVAAFVVIFFVGVGVGKLTRSSPHKTSSNYSNYSTKQTPAAEKSPPATESKTEAATPEQAASPATAVAEVAAPLVLGATTNGPCIVKGTKSKIYHIKGGTFYDRVTKPVACFKTEEEAKAAGFRKSSK